MPNGLTSNEANRRLLKEGPNLVEEKQPHRALLRSHLNIQARVLRDGIWQLIKTEDLVRGDIVHLRMGDITPADIHLIKGQVMIDQSSLTGDWKNVKI